MSVPKRTAEQINFCDSLNDLWDSQSKWSQATFGSDFERGPIGALKHLELEAREAYEAYSVASGNYHEELADCFLLLMDACRRSGLSIHGLVSVARTKHARNKKRRWSKPAGDNPVEHVRDEAGAEIDFAKITKTLDGYDCHYFGVRESYGTKVHCFGVWVNSGVIEKCYDDQGRRLSFAFGRWELSAKKPLAIVENFERVYMPEVVNNTVGDYLKQIEKPTGDNPVEHVRDEAAAE